MDLVALLNLGKKETRRAHDGRDRTPGKRRRDRRGAELRNRPRGERATATADSSRAH